MHGKVALVTDGGSGIGAGIARVLAASGGRVAVADLNQDAAAAVAADLSGLGVRLDVTDRASTDAAVSRVEAELGAYLASDVAANITGEALNVSGGQQMH
jgi:NAD(P)-dependent dehydrogenase (short-subunit alcohol dehydrogenase family)